MRQSPDTVNMPVTSDNLNAPPKPSGSIVAHRRLVGCLDVSGTYKPGDQAPAGYNNWHEWARIQHKAGLRQRRCGRCSLMKYPQEMSDKTDTMKATTRKYGGDTVTLTWPICNACAANAEVSGPPPVTPESKQGATGGFAAPTG